MSNSSSRYSRARRNYETLQRDVHRNRVTLSRSYDSNARHNHANFEVIYPIIEFIPSRPTSNIETPLLTPQPSLQEEKLEEAVFFQSLYDFKQDSNSIVSLQIKNHLRCVKTEIPHCEICSTASECSICQNSFKLYDKLALLPACNHLFHLYCMQEWGNRNQSCPLCRTPVEIYQR
jgi:hypothetical protein